MPELNHGRPQTKARPLAKKAKQQTDAQATNSKNQRFAIGFIQSGEVHMI
jgi:hypothetical protein